MDANRNPFTDFLWLISGAVWLPIYLVTRPFGYDAKWLRWWGNRVDNFPDALKEAIHCGRIPFSGNPGYQFNISVIMKNREPKTWDIIRKHKDYDNCDPEDFN